MELRKSSLSSAAAVFCILMCAYLLTFNGVSSTDDEQLYISLTESLANGSGFSAVQLLGNDRLQGNTNSVEPFHSIAGVPLYLLAQSLHIGKAQVLFILPAIYTALAGAVLSITASLQGYSIVTTLLAGLAYGIGTIAFPYARTNFREPLAALSITCAALFFEIQKYGSTSNKQRTLSVLLLFAALGSAVFTKITTVVIVPLYATALLGQKHIWEEGVRGGTLFGLAVVSATAAAALIGITLLLPPESLHRFSIAFADYIRYTLPRLPHDHFWDAMAGQFFSPGKGLFIYSPILILALLKRSTARRSNWLLCYGPVIALAATQALIYNDAWWGITWGTRALVPVLPLLVLAALPAAEQILTHGNRVKKFMLHGVFFLSIFIQTGRLAAADTVYTGWLTNREGMAIHSAMQWKLSLAPFFRYWWLGFQGRFSDIAWFHTQQAGNGRLTLLFLCGAASMGAAGLFLFWKEQSKWLLVLSLSACLAMTLITPSAAASDARYFSRIAYFSSANEVLCDLTEKDDLVLIDFYLDPLWWYYSNFSCPQAQWVGLPYAHNTAITGDLFYPRLDSTAALITAQMPFGDVYLVSASQIENLTYQEAFRSQGFQLLLVSTVESQPLEIYRLINE